VMLAFRRRVLFFVVASLNLVCFLWYVATERTRT
jgi:hypothetical protein